MTEYIKHRVKSFETVSQDNLVKVLTAIQTDLTNLKTDVAALDTALDALAAKLNLDAGVTDVDYAGAGTMTSGTLTLQV